LFSFWLSRPQKVSFLFAFWLSFPQKLIIFVFILVIVSSKLSFLFSFWLSFPQKSSFLLSFRIKNSILVNIVGIVSSTNDGNEKNHDDENEKT